MNFNTPVSQLTKVGATTSKRLERLGIKTALDLLYYFPFRYEDYRQVVEIKDLHEGMAVSVKGKIELIANRRSPRSRKNITEALVSDESGSVRVVWFNQPFLIKNLLIGDVVFLSGTVKSDMLGPEFVSPNYEKVAQSTTSTARLVPIYPLTEGITQKQIHFLIKQVLPLAKEIKEWLPEKILAANDLVLLYQALEGIHFPEDEKHLTMSTERLKFDELLLLQLKAEKSRLQKSKSIASEIIFKEKEIREFVGKLPFALTAPQKVSAWEILQDINKPHPMNRLLSGDVGSGKTVVAAIAMYSAVLNGYQAVLMAPTEILARQHYDSVSAVLGNKAKVGLLSGSQFSIFNFQFPINFQRRKIKSEVVDKINGGEINIIIGTHALLSENVIFQNLGMVIVDEQHRFGVEQRKMIKEKSVTHPSASPLEKGRERMATHFLSMTATPIPRSLALMVYGDLDVSIIDQLPPGRKKIITRLVEPLNRQKAYGFIREQVKAGRQVFVVCPIIDNGDSPLEGGSGGVRSLESQVFQRSANFMSPTPHTPQPRSQGGDKKSVLSEYEKLSKKIFSDLRVGYLHGKLKPKEKEDIMNLFKKGEVDVLVSTSVIEVGVDIPNASVMMIEGADRFGLAQLHQFRGRVGRSSHQSYCLLFTDNNSPRVLERLKFFETHNDGFKLAEKDLDMRGPGEVYGTEQSGMMQLRLAKLTDKEIIKKARDSARELMKEISKYPTILEKVEEWEKTVHLE